jgi:LysM repeat protein
MKLTHEQARKLIETSLQAGLTENERKFLSDHLHDCGDCQEYQKEWVDNEGRISQSLKERWPEPVYPRSELIKRAATIQGGGRSPKMWHTLAMVGRTTAGAVLLLLIVAGLVWIVGGTAPLRPGNGGIAVTATPEKQIGCMAIDIYQVQAGDSLGSIAQMFGISVEQIQALNGLAGGVQPGQMIKLMGCPMTYGTPFPGENYQVQAGDTCESIAQANHTNVANMRALNGLDRNCALRAGQRLILPLSNSVVAMRKIRLYYFSGDDCGKGCSEARSFLDDLMGQVRGLDVVEYNADAMPTNRQLYGLMAARVGMPATILPAIFLGDRFWIGFEGATGADVAAAVLDCQTSGCTDTQEIVGGYPAPQVSPSPASITDCGEVTDMLVKNGDTVSSIANEFGVAADLIRQVNGIEGDQLDPGMHIRIVGCPINYGTPYPEEIYVVQAGDTCHSIASQFQVSTGSLRGLNNLSTACEISIGQQLAVPWFKDGPKNGQETPVISETHTTLDGRISIDQAQGLVRDWIFANQPEMNPTATFPVEEITPEDAWQRMAVQVFKVTDGVDIYETFLVHQGQVVQLGTAFGGMGVEHMAVTDLDNDQNPELLFTYSFGSGIHQSSLGIVVTRDGKPEVILANEVHYQGDFTLQQVSDQDVFLEGNANGQTQLEPLGKIHYQDGILTVTAQ